MSLTAGRPGAPAADPARLACGGCGASYAPSLVGGACPVCRTPAPGAAGRPRRALRDDDRMLLVVALATLANLILLGVLAAAVLS